jgi:predicted PurR-regulated permease PerM
MTHTPHARRFFYVLLSLVLIGGALFLRPYLMVVLFASILGLLFHGMYAWIERICGGRQWLAVPLSMIGVLLTFVVPVAITGALVAHVVSSFAHSASSANLVSQFSLTATIDQINHFLSTIPGVHYTISIDMVNGKLQDIIAVLRNGVWHGLEGLGGTIAFLIPATFITIYVMGAVFTHYHKINDYLHRISPLDDTIDSLYARRISAMITSMVRGTFVIATLQGIFTGIFLWIGGVPYAAFFGLITVVLSIIPLGSGLIALPAGVLLILTGAVWQGVLQIAGYFIVITNTDNFLRPKLVSKEANLHPALTLLGAFTGIAQFGFLGLIYGPVIMVVLTTTIEVYRQYFAPKD